MYAKILAETDQTVLESELNEFLKVIKDKGWNLLDIKYGTFYAPITETEKNLIYSLIVIFEGKNAS
jgi:hypothetical protein